MSGYRKFSDRLKNEFGAAGPAKVAKPAKGEGGEVETLAALAGLAGPHPETRNPDAAEERAAIVEYEAGVPRAWAEGFARLDPDRPAADVPPKRWLTFIDDVGRFLDGSFAEKAAALGWGPFDLFGCDRDRPFARTDRCGLLWLLKGDRLIALTAETAVIETAAGVRQTYRRRPGVPGGVLPWELAP
jgi:hypothetical protein